MEFAGKMPIQRGPMPTLDGVVEKIKALEDRYSVATEFLVCQEGRVNGVDPDDAVEWLALAEQAQVLKEAAVESLYSTHSSVSLINDPSPEKLAA